MDLRYLNLVFRLVYWLPFWIGVSLGIEPKTAVAQNYNLPHVLLRQRASTLNSPCGELLSFSESFQLPPAVREAFERYAEYMEKGNPQLAQSIIKREFLIPYAPVSPGGAHFSNYRYRFSQIKDSLKEEYFTDPDKHAIQNQIDDYFEYTLNEKRLPGFSQISFLKDALDKLGYESPYFKEVIEIRILYSAAVLQTPSMDPTQVADAIDELFRLCEIPSAKVYALRALLSKKNWLKPIDLAKTAQDGQTAEEYSEFSALARLDNLFSSSQIRAFDLLNSGALTVSSIWSKGPVTEEILLLLEIEEILYLNHAYRLIEKLHHWSQIPGTTLAQRAGLLNIIKTLQNRLSHPSSNIEPPRTYLDLLRSLKNFHYDPMHTLFWITNTGPINSVPSPRRVSMDLAMLALQNARVGRKHSFGQAYAEALAEAIYKLTVVAAKEDLTVIQGHTKYIDSDYARHQLNLLFPPEKETSKASQ